MTLEKKHRLWDQFENESSLWYERFMRFLEQEPSARSLNKCYRESFEAENKKPKANLPKQWTDAYHEFKWEQRVSAYDLSLRDKRESDNVAFVNDIRHQMKQRVNQLMERADEMMSFPFSQTIEDDEAGTRIIMPANFKTSDAPRYLKVAKELAVFIANNPVLADRSTKEGSGGMRGSGLSGTVVNESVKAEVTPEFEEMSNEQLMIYVLAKIDPSTMEDFS